MLKNVYFNLSQRHTSALLRWVRKSVVSRMLHRSLLLRWRGWNVLELAVGEGEKRAQRGTPQPHIGAEAAQCLINAQETAAKLAIGNFCFVRLTPHTRFL